nr:MAG TPA: hypothetical protein [Caudoviricetes sp.]
MDFLFIAYLFLLLMGLLIYLSSSKELQPPYLTNFMDGLITDINYSLRAINWYPVTDRRQYVILVIGIVLGYLLG